MLLFRIIGDPHTMGGEQGHGIPAHFFLEQIRNSDIIILHLKEKGFHGKPN